ncbi:2Fe-2S iron-sulfur cluster-binding protein [Amycolatopsis acididurans]|uniref:2Fe-2S iron-sulfur cluster-binding protein n=1 Tax=Amycolatopsis acididurans TaxID=2724524 RepID=UPI001B341F49|nr:2Fe-2S iron-sulfur cluster-binding protein [Amycolatopsis acididurans]
MARVVVEPAGFTIDVEPGESLADAAWRQGYRWPTTCWGKAECTVCAVVVVGGAEATLPAEDEETGALRDRMPRHLRTTRSRLACRLRFREDGAVVEKRGVRPPPEPAG